MGSARAPEACDASIARLVVLANRPSGLIFAFDIGPPADLPEPALTERVVTPSIRPGIATAFAHIQHHHQV